MTENLKNNRISKLKTRLDMNNKFAASKVNHERQEEKSA